KDQSIGGFKIGEIEPDSVKLVSPTNEIDLKIGMQMSRSDQGPWNLSQRPENFDGARIAGADWSARPAARTERESQPQQDGPPFGFPGGNLPDAIAQAIQGAVQQGIQLPPGAAPVTVTDQNGLPTTINVPPPAANNSSGAAESPDVVLRRLIE